MLRRLGAGERIRTADYPLTRSFRALSLTAAFLVSAGFLVVWLPLAVPHFRPVLARGWHDRDSRPWDVIWLASGPADGRLRCLQELRLGKDQADRLPQSAGLRDDVLSDLAEKVSGPVPLPHVVRAELGRLRAGGVAAESLLHGDIQVIEAGNATMIAVQGGQHQLISVSVEDAVKDDVISMVQRIACYLVDQPDVRTVGRVALLEYVAPEIVLADEGDSPAMPRADLRRDRALARAGVPAQDDEPG